MHISQLTTLFSILLTFNSLAQKNKSIPSESTEQYPVPATSTNQLFYIQRSSNINSIIYDANMGNDKKLDIKIPFILIGFFTHKGKKNRNLQVFNAHWLMGFTRPAIGESETYDGYLFAYRRRKFVVKINTKGEPIALFPINGKMQILKKSL